jgi:hypothetical protein
MDDAEQVFAGSTHLTHLTPAEKTRATLSPQGRPGVNAAPPSVANSFGLRIFAGTWNMGEAEPHTETMGEWLQVRASRPCC